MSPKVLKIALVAGEASSDMLGARLIDDLFKRHSCVEIIAVGGARIQATSAKVIQDNEVFSVMGLAEVLKDLPQLLKIKKQIVKKIVAFKPDVFIGVDSPDLNFSIAKSLKSHHIPVIHYVSPSVWAWRPNRIFKMQKFIDYLLTLFPFEVDIYQPTSIQAAFVGHPLAQKIPLQVDKKRNKQQINAASKKVFALLPGSRNREIKTLMPLFAAAVKQMSLNDEWQIFSSNVSPAKIKLVDAIAAEHQLNITWVDDATDLLLAADFALLGSGTVALEAMLCKTPMVVGYQISKVTWWIVKSFKMLQLPYYSLPNVLSGRFLVPEVMQADLTVEHLSQVCTDTINDPKQADTLAAFTQLHQTLIPEQPDQAARLVLDFVASRC